MKARYSRYNLKFKQASGTSRGILREKETWFLHLEDEGQIGIGECGLLRGLSYDDTPFYEEKLKWVCNRINVGKEVSFQELEEFPSIQMGLEMAKLSLKSDDPYILFPSDFSKKNEPIAINGLIWMGNKEFMFSQIQEKVKQGFHCLKMKIGAIDFQEELKLLSFIRERFSSDEIELRVDANGAFSTKDALTKIELLSKYDIHSIEQPISTNQRKEMAKLCEETSIPIALDEELIGIFGDENKKELLESIKPQYIILKPSFVGGFSGTQSWIEVAKKQKIDWWITSALESNIGLNAIAQWTSFVKAKGCQGLGTGSLFMNNIESPLEVKEGHLFYNKRKKWNKKIDF